MIEVNLDEIGSHEGVQTEPKGFKTIVHSRISQAAKQGLFLADTIETFLVSFVQANSRVVKQLLKDVVARYDEQA